LSVIFYTILPLLQVGFTWYLRQRTRNNAMFSVGGSIDTIGGALGFASVTNAELLARAVPALVYLIIAIFAWRGKPGVVRYVMVVSVFVIFFWYSGLTYLQALEDRQVQAYSSSAFESVLRNSYYISAGLVALYILWYMNRGPARAFYRGHYLHDTS
jgi:hypothetical protein